MTLRRTKRALARAARSGLVLVELHAPRHRAWHAAGHAGHHARLSGVESWLKHRGRAGKLARWCPRHRLARLPLHAPTCGPAPQACAARLVLPTWLSLPRHEAGWSCLNLACKTGRRRLIVPSLRWLSLGLHDGFQVGLQGVALWNRLHVFLLWGRVSALTAQAWKGEIQHRRRRCSRRAWHVDCIACDFDVSPRRTGILDVLRTPVPAGWP